MVTRWQDPATSHIVFTKILTLVIGGDQSLVRAGEDDLCRQVKKVPCKPAYLAMPASMRSDIPAAKALVRKHGQEGLAKVAKLHFKTTKAVLGES